MIEWIGYLFKHKETTEQNTAELKEQKHEVRSLTSGMERLAFEVARTRENEAHEREKLALRLELLLSQRGTAPAISQQEAERSEFLRRIEELEQELATLRGQQETKKLG